MSSSSSGSLAFVRLTIGSVVEGRYEILRELGQGGMGTVYEAKQIKLNKRVALKVLQPERAQRDDDGNSQKRFLREARVASAIDHRNVVDIIDFGDLEDGSTYYVMELLEGRDLSSLLKNEGVEVVIETGAGDSAGHPDSQYEEAGAKVGSHADVLVSDLILHVAPLSTSEIGELNKGQYLIV